MLLFIFSLTLCFTHVFPKIVYQPPRFYEACFAENMGVIFFNQIIKKNVRLFKETFPGNWALYL